MPRVRRRAPTANRFEALATPSRGDELSGDEFDGEMESRMHSDQGVLSAAQMVLDGDGGAEDEEPISDERVGGELPDPDAADDSPLRGRQLLQGDEGEGEEAEPFSLKTFVRRTRTRKVQW